MRPLDQTLLAESSQVSSHGSSANAEQFTKFRNGGTIVLLYNLHYLIPPPCR